MNTEIINIEKIVFGGKGLGHHSDGKVVLVDSVLPGETAEVILTEKKGIMKAGCRKSLPLPVTESKANVLITTDAADAT